MKLSRKHSAWLGKAVERSRLHESNGRTSVYSIALGSASKPIAEAGNNYIRTHSKQKSVAASVGLPEKECLHSEMLTIIRANGRKIKTLYIARTLADGTTAPAKPCLVCQAMIEEKELLQGNKIELIYT